MWTSEPGVGRDKSTLITFQADLKDGGGGDYYNTNYPQPTYISSRRYALHDVVCRGGGDGSAGAATAVPAFA